MPYAMSQAMEVQIMHGNIKILDQDPALIARVLAAAGGPPKRAVRTDVQRPRPDHDEVFQHYNPESVDPIEQTLCIPREDVPPISGD